MKLYWNIPWLVLATSVVGVFIAPARADDWPQWRGPQRDGIWREMGIVDAIADSRLPVKWRMPIGGGYSGPAVADGRVYVMDYQRQTGNATKESGQRDALQEDERVICFDAETGSEIWRHTYNCSYSISYACGPRATPTVDDGHVYTLGAEGHLRCLDAATGELVWSSVMKENSAVKTPGWGFASHPLIHGQHLITLKVRAENQGSVVCLDKSNGEEVWEHEFPFEIGYCPASSVSIGGVQQILVWHAGAVEGIDPGTGEPMWSFPLKPDSGMAIAAPQLAGSTVFASARKTTGAVFDVEQSAGGFTTQLKWTGDKDLGLFCANVTPYIEGGVVYGVDHAPGWLTAARLSDGQRLWTTYEPTTGARRARHATAFLVRHEDRTFLFNEAGDLILARLTPEGYEEIGRAHILEPTGVAFGRSVVWSHPAFADRCLFARNDCEIVCVSLAE